MQKKAIALAIVAALILGAGVGLGVVLGRDSGGGNGNASAVAATSTPRSGTTTSGQASTSSDCQSAAEIYARLRPAVVEIHSRGASSSPFGLPSEGTGSGVIINADGTILTNNHVIDNADTLEVQFADGASISGHVAGTDPGNDLAVVKADITDQKLTTATLGDSGALRVGDPVLAIGNPFSLEGTLTQGIVSGLERTFSEGGNTRPIRNMIQTDAPVNPGNSGGPLINCQGEVVGINTLLENPTGDNVNVGIAFAVASNTAKASLPSMQNNQTVQHPWLGMGGEALTPALAGDLNLKVDKGVYVTLVANASPADSAGLRGAYASEEAAASDQNNTPPSGGDVIVEADGHAVASVEDLAAYLDANKRPGDNVELKVNRDGDELSITATLADWPA